MTPLAKLAVLGSAAAGTAAAASLAWMTIGGASQKGSAQQPGKPGGVELDRVIVCAGSDSVLRAADPASGCPAGQTTVPLTPGEESGVPKILDRDPDDSSDAGNKSTRPSDALGGLERRLDNLRLSPLFTVVDAHGHPIFALRPQGVLLYNAAGSPVIAVRQSDEGGIFRAISTDGTMMASAGALRERAGLRLTEGGVPRLDMSRQPSNAYALKVLSLNSKSEPVAAIGESRASTGAIIVADTNGRIKASMTLSEGRGAVSVLNDSGIPVVSLTQAEAAGGLFRLTSPTGDVVVKMNVPGDRYGAVLTGPAAGFPYVPSSGLPGSYFFGCAGGEACRD